MTDYTLTADAGALTYTGYGTPARLFGGFGHFGVSGQLAALARNIEVTATALTLKLTRLRLHEPIVTQGGKPQPQFQQWWQRQCEAIEQAFAGLANQVAAIQAAYDAAAQANAAASNANNAVTEVETALVDVQEVSDQLQAGTLNVPAITIGGTKFVNDGAGDLVAAP